MINRKVSVSIYLTRKTIFPSCRMSLYNESVNITAEIHFKVVLVHFAINIYYTVVKQM